VEIVLDWSLYQDVEDFYQDILNQLKSPSWHGNNLNALSFICLVHFLVSGVLHVLLAFSALP